MANRLKQARAAAGFKTASEAARAIGVKGPAYCHHENGTRAFYDTAALYARKYGCTLDWLIANRGTMKGAPFVPVRGQVGAGELVEPEHSAEEIKRGPHFELPRPADTEAFVVRGDSMQPRFFRGEILLFDSQPVPPKTLLGQICRVELDDGVSFVKILRSGGAGLFDLESMRLYEAPITSVRVRHAYRWRGLFPPRDITAFFVIKTNDHTAATAK